MRRRLFAAWLMVASTPAMAADLPAGPPNPYEQDMQDYEKQDRDDPPRRGGILFLGGSTFRLWSPIAQDFTGLTIIGRGYSGWKLEDAVRFATRTSLVYRPRIIVLDAGGVDLRNGRTPQEVLAFFQTYVATVRATLPGTRIIFLSLTPSPGLARSGSRRMELNRLVAEYVSVSKNLGFIDLWTPMLGPDGRARNELFETDTYQPSREGFLLRAKVIDPDLRGAQ